VSVENKASRVRSDVGRVARPGGAAIRRPPARPLTMRMLYDFSR
jgi:hypothetical protein